MSNTLTPIDISTMPDLARIVEEVAATKKPRELKRGNTTVAVLSPASAKNTEKWEKIRATFGSWSDLDADELIATIHRWREEGSRPATRP
jgi:poly-gamma-glutamate capsule biosynthesis protein CapA/YwtB (metallophosphatase superfamily)